MGQGAGPVFGAEHVPRIPFPIPETPLHDRAGHRLCLHAGERAAFLVVARRRSARVDPGGGTVTIRSLKKRRDAAGRPRVVFRSVPVPPDDRDTLDTAHDLRRAQRSRRKARAPIWPIGRTRIWQVVKRFMVRGQAPTPPQG